MTRVEAWLEGTRPLLQRRLTGGGERPASAHDEAERYTYRDEDGGLCLPSSAVVALLREAGAKYKAEATGESVRRLVPAAVGVEGDLVPLFDKAHARPRTFAVDTRPVTIPPHGTRVLRHRPRLDTWAARLRFALEEDILPAVMVKRLLVDGGKLLGLGDYRPEHGGPFGTFRLAAWKELPS